MAKSSKSKPRENPQLRLKELGQDLAQQIQKGKNPEMEFGLRSLSNVVYDTKYRTLNLGSKTQTRSFFNVGHAKQQDPDAQLLQRGPREEVPADRGDGQGLQDAA